MVNQEITIAVRCSEPMKYFIYQIVGRGDILLSRSVEVSVKNKNNAKKKKNVIKIFHLITGTG